MSRGLATVWSDFSGEACPLNEYPRPQLVRPQWLNLNGHWDYAIEAKAQGRRARFPARPDGKILVPFAVESALSGVERPLLPEQQLWYRRQFTLPPAWAGQRILLNFEAVDWLCDCYINGRHAGSHQGGYLPFSFDITELLTGGDNLVELRVEDPTDSGSQQRGKQVLKPRTIYYQATSGIWQTVWLEPVARENHITSFSCIPRLDRSCFEISVDTANSARTTQATEVEVILWQQGEQGREVIQHIRGRSDSMLTLRVDSPRLWSPADPFLYQLTIRLRTAQGVIDEISSYTAMRKVSAVTAASGHKRIALNNTPLFVHGPLDQGYWPESGMTAPADEALIFDIGQMKALGFNLIRKHIKVESRRWYYHADRLGMLVQQDMISGGRDAVLPFFLERAGLTVKDSSRLIYRLAKRSRVQERAAFEQELLGMIRLLKNHPSVICWVPFNEGWGQFDTRRIGQRVLAEDDSRLVDQNSGWLDQDGGDFLSLHRYNRPLEKKRPGEERIHLISEYGGFNLDLPGHMWDAKKQYGYRAFPSRDAYEQALRQLMQEQLLPIIAHGLSGAVYTQLSDVEIESNGLYSYDRKVLKADPQLIQQLNQRLYQAFDQAEKLKPSAYSRSADNNPVAAVDASPGVRTR